MNYYNEPVVTSLIDKLVLRAVENLLSRFVFLRPVEERLEVDFSNDSGVSVSPGAPDWRPPDHLETDPAAPDDLED